MDIKAISTSEISKPSLSENKSFNPDKRVDVNQKRDTNSTPRNDVDKRVDVKNDANASEKTSSDSVDKRVKSAEDRDSIPKDKTENVSHKNDFVISKEPIGVEKKEIGIAKENKEKGIEREHKFHNYLSLRYPKALGYEVMQEKVLRDKNGNVVKDTQTSSARRIDFVVAKNGNIIKSFEVTSKSAPKDNQMAKEYRIKDSGGRYVKNSNGDLLRIPNNVQTEIVRMR